MSKGYRMGESVESVFDYFRRSIKIGTFLKIVINTKLLTPPDTSKIQ
ncbi:hypothetical protein LEP1GSC047_1170 [Leptospira inadai serovar Lyme str. 10]|uniref:Uncharacterized protein n=1 Tax=Leptospira inadai serovar Lyme str. 10 TaxID=1049790 RepID=V6H9X4_9LEPT|nr:hypothetical protein LEP1GSC047_1170 [Leptospira inadai serovar Lyme str. 10]